MDDKERAVLEHLLDERRDWVRRHSIKPAEPVPVRSAEVVQVIRTDTLIGEGIESDPMRIVTQYFTLDGKHLVKLDDWEDRLPRDEVEDTPGGGE